MMRIIVPRNSAAGSRIYPLVGKHERGEKSQNPDQPDPRPTVRILRAVFTVCERNEMLSVVFMLAVIRTRCLGDTYYGFFDDV